MSPETYRDQAVRNRDVTGVSYNVGVPRQLAAVGMRVAPVSPVQLARWVGEVLR